jgi:hypothetical protein
MYLFVVHLAMLSIASNVQRRMIGCSLNNESESMLMEATMALFQIPSRNVSEVSGKDHGISQSGLPISGLELGSY